MEKVTPWAMFAGIVLALFGVATAQQPAGELVIRNGTIVNATGRTVSDVRIRNGVIAEIARNITAPAGARVIDAKGKLLLPGGFDAHVHLSPEPNRPSADDYRTASIQALAGGITTLAQFSNLGGAAGPAGRGGAGAPAPGGGAAATAEIPASAVQAMLEREAAFVKKQAIVDMIMHTTVNSPNLPPATLSAMAERGMGLKFFMSRPAFDANAMGYLELLRRTAAAGMLTLIHAEDAAILTATGERMLREGRGAIRYFPESRPDYAEEVAVQRAVTMSQDTGAPIYLVHTSSQRALRAAEAGMARGLPVFVETRILYLFLTKERFEEPEGAIYTGDPPLREKKDVEAIWEGIRKGTVHVVATDSLAYSKPEKLDPTLDVVNHRPGGAYIQDLLPLMYSEGVRKKRITAEQMVTVTSANPAKLFGIYPRKGTIAVGSDGDIAIWDTELKKTIRDENSLSNGKHSVFNGWEVTGWPVVTIRRGDVLFENGKVTGTPGTGLLLPRKKWQKP